MKQRKLLFAFALLLSIPSLALAAGALKMRQNQAALAQHNLSAQELSGLIAAQNHLSKTLPLWGQGGDCDAGPLLNPVLALEDSSYPAQAPPWWAEMDWPREGPPGRRGTNVSWLEHPERVPTGDFSIFQEIQACGRWDSGSSGAYQDYLDSGAQDPALSAPIPMLIPLQYLAKSYLAAGLRGDVDMVQTLEGVRHLAALCHDGEELISTLIALTLLNFERQAYERAVALELLDPESWQPVSEQDLELAKATLFATMHVYEGRGPEGGLDQLQANPLARFGQCGALQHAIARVGADEAILGAAHPWPGEPDHRAHHAGLREVLAQSACRLPQLRASDAHPEWFTQEHADQLFYSEEKAPWILRVPYWRHAESEGTRHMTPEPLDQVYRERLSQFP